MYVIVMFNILYKASPGTPNMVLVNRKVLLIFMEDIWGGGDSNLPHQRLF